MIADSGSDVATVADALGADRSHVEGHSGGGSHALACASRLSDRVLAAAVIASAALIAAALVTFAVGLIQTA